MNIRKVYGSIQILGYSHDNRFASFQLYMHKPVKGVVAIGVYNFDQELTLIKKVRRSLGKDLDPYWIEIANKILSTNDWDINVKRICSRHSWIPVRTFMEIRQRCKY